MKNITTPISLSKAMLMGGNKKVLINSEKKALSYLRLISDIWVNDPMVMGKEISPNAKLEDVLDIFQYDDYCTRLQMITQTNEVNIIPKENGRKAYAETIVISNEESSTGYVFHVSFLAPMKLISIEFYNLFICCLALFRKIGIDPFEHDRWGWDSELENYSTDEDNVERVINNDERNGTISKEEIEAEYLEVIERDRKRFNPKMIEDIRSKVFDTNEFMELLTSIPLNIQPNIALKEFAWSMINLINSRNIGSFSTESIKDFFKRNHDTDDEEFINDNFPITYEDIFYISWANQELVGDWLCDALGSYAGEYGQVEYFKKFIIKNKKDIAKVKKITSNELAVLRDLPGIFRAGYKLAVDVEQYLKEKYHGKKEKC